MSPLAARSFQFGFNDLGGPTEELVFRTLPADTHTDMIPPPVSNGQASQTGGGMTYTAYRWNGDRFEPDSFAFESRLKNLSPDVWRFGTGL
jgi:hypothetical protein